MLASSASIAASRASSSVFSRSRRRRRSRSMARLRAVVVIQAPGLSGTPRPASVSSAVDERFLDGLLGEVEVAEDADERRDRPARFVAEQAVDDLVGGRRPARSAGPTRFGERLHRLIAEVDDRPDLDRALLRTGDARRIVDGLVEIGRLHDIEPAEDLLGLGERSIGRRSSVRRARGRSSRWPWAGAPLRPSSRRGPRRARVKALYSSIVAAITSGTAPRWAPACRSTARTASVGSSTRARRDRSGPFTATTNGPRRFRQRDGPESTARCHVPIDLARSWTGSSSEPARGRPGAVAGPSGVPFRACRRPRRSSRSAATRSRSRTRRRCTSPMRDTRSSTSSSTTSRSRMGR